MTEHNPPPEYLSQSPTSPGLDQAYEARQQAESASGGEAECLDQTANAGIGDIIAPDEATTGATGGARQRGDLEKEAMRTVLEYDGSWDKALQALESLESNAAAMLALRAGGIEHARRALEQARQQIGA